MLFPLWPKHVGNFLQSGVQQFQKNLKKMAWHHRCFKHDDDCKSQKNKQKVKAMKIKLIKVATVMAAVIGVSGIANACLVNPISGNITFVGGVTLDTSSAGTATEVLSWTGPGGTGMPIVLSDDGSFSSIAPGTPVSFTAPWFFNSGAVAGLWSVGGFSFDLTSSHIVFQGGSPAGVIVDGNGMVSGPCWLGDAAMTWSFTTQDPGANGDGSMIFSFSAASGTVPDGGMTAMLLGLGVLGLGLLKKQIVA